MASFALEAGGCVLVASEEAGAGGCVFLASGCVGIGAVCGSRSAGLMPTGPPGVACSPNASGHAGITGELTAVDSSAPASASIAVLPPSFSHGSSGQTTTGSAGACPEDWGCLDGSEEESIGGTRRVSLF